MIKNQENTLLVHLLKGDNKKIKLFWGKPTKNSTWDNPTPSAIRPTAIGPGARS